MTQPAGTEEGMTNIFQIPAVPGDHRYECTGRTYETNDVINMTELMLVIRMFHTALNGAVVHSGACTVVRM